MKNDFKIQRQTMIKEVMNNHPEFVNAKKLILIMCLIFITARFLFVGLEISFILNKGLDLTTGIMNVALLGVAILFALGIYGGNKGLAYLAIIGGFYSLFNLWQQNYNMQITDSFYKFYVIIFVIVMLIQIISMIVVLINKPSKSYFNEMGIINKKLMEQNKQSRKKQ